MVRNVFLLSNVPKYNNFGVNLTLITEKPLNKGIEASEVNSFNLTQTSPKPHSSINLLMSGKVRIK